MQQFFSLTEENQDGRYIKVKVCFGGIAIGKISVYKKDEQLVKRVKIEDADVENGEIHKLPVILRLHSFRSCMIKALKEVGEANAAIF